MITLEGVRYSYPEAPRPALDHIDLTIRSGERILVGGISGSGKSTLLRTVNGLVPHFYGGRFSGHATILGVDTRTASPQSLAAWVGTVFQDLPARFLTNSVEDEIAFSLEVGGVDPQAIPGRVQQIAERMGVMSLAGRRLESLSAGEQARLAIAAAVAREPRVLVLDEPVTHLDPAGAQAVVDWVDQLSREDGVTVVLAEHRVEGWREIIDREVCLGMDGALQTAPQPFDLGRAPFPHLETEVGSITPRSLRVRGLQVGYGRRIVLRDVDLELAPGDLMALIGRNGSGKTTLLRAMIGLQRPEAGEIQLDGRSVVHRPLGETARSIGYVPQAPASMLFAETAEEEIALTLRSHARPHPAESAALWLEAFGLLAVRQRYPRDLSAGERQRLALAAILAARPSVLLLDEPTLGMDRARLAWLGRILKELSAAGCAILVATHDAGFAAEHATRAALVEGGRIAAQGEPGDVLQADPGFAQALARWRAEPGITDRSTTSEGVHHADR